MLNLQTQQDLQDLKEQHDSVLVIIYGNNCMPCNQMKAWLSTIISDYPNTIFSMLSGTDNRDWAVQHNIRTVPTTIIYDKYDTSTTYTGFNSQIQNQIKENLDRVEKDSSNEF